MEVSMRISPRQHLLELWSAYAAAVRPDGKEWLWGGQSESNSIGDAEQLMVLLCPATEIAGFALDNPDNTEEDVLHALKKLGDAVTIPRLVLDQLAEFLARNTDKNGEPTFTAPGYMVPDRPEELSPQQLELEVVESYSISLTLCLAAAGFTKAFSNAVTRDELRNRVRTVDAAIKKRLTAAMVGLLRSFTVTTIKAGSTEQENLLFMLNQGRAPGREGMARLHRRLEGVRAQLPELTIGLAQDIEIFHCERCGRGLPRSAAGSPGGEGRAVPPVDRDRPPPPRGHAGLLGG
jgi:hypothetical protein